MALEDDWSGRLLKGAELSLDRKIRVLGTYQVPNLLRVKLWPQHITKYKLNNQSRNAEGALQAPVHERIELQFLNQ